MIVMTIAILRSTKARVRPYLNKTKISNNKTRTDDPDKSFPAVEDQCLGFLLHRTCQSPLLHSEISIYIYVPTYLSREAESKIATVSYISKVFYITLEKNSDLFLITQSPCDMPCHCIC